MTKQNPRRTLASVPSWPEAKAAHTAYKALLKTKTATPEQKRLALDRLKAKLRASLRQANIG